MSGEIGRRPRRLRIDALHHRTLIGYGDERPATASRRDRADRGDEAARPLLTLIKTDG